MEGGYKSIMLSERPAPERPAPTGQPPFYTSVMKTDAWGYCKPRDVVTFESVERGRKKRVNKYAAQNRRFIKNLERENRDRAEDDERQQYVNAMRSKRLQNYAARFRDAVRSGISVPEATSSSSTPMRPTRSAGYRRPKQAVRHRPAWAVTEAQLEEAQDNEVEELIDFAANLDYDSYIETIETLPTQSEPIVPVAADDDDDDDECAVVGGDAEVVVEGDEAFEMDWEPSDAVQVQRSQPQQAQQERVVRPIRAPAPASASAPGPMQGPEQSYQHVLRETSERMLHSSHAVRRFHSMQSLKALVDRQLRDRYETDELRQSWSGKRHVRPGYGSDLPPIPNSYTAEFETEYGHMCMTGRSGD